MMQPFAVAVIEIRARCENVSEISHGLHHTQRVNRGTG
jgi:hypothetical protein